MNKKLMFAILLIFLICFIIYQTQSLFTLENAQRYQQQLSQLIEQHYLLVASIYFISYVVITALSIPGATVVTLLGAALFGFWHSLVLVSFASSIGATLAFLISRYFLHHWVQHRFHDKLSTINQGMAKDGAFYLLSLRLIPIFPFFIINLIMGLTSISTRRFYVISQLGMLPGTAIYLNAGTQLAHLQSLAGLISPTVLASLGLLGVFPIVAKRLLKK